MEHLEKKVVWLEVTEKGTVKCENLEKMSRARSGYKIWMGTSVFSLRKIRSQGDMRQRIYICLE